MSDAAIAKTYGSSVDNSMVDGSYTGAATVAQSGQTVQLADFKASDIVVESCGNPLLHMTTSQALNLTVSQTSTQITVHFDLSTNVSVDFKGCDGLPVTFSAGVAISGDFTLKCTTTNYCDAINSCCSQLQTICGNSNPCGSDGKIVISGSTFDLSAQTSLFFTDGSSSGSAALILAHNKVTNFASAVVSDGDSSADAVATAGGALALAMAFASESHTGDPLQGFTTYDIAMLKALGLDAAVMSADTSTATAQAATVATTYLGAQLALDYANRALAVANAAPTDLALAASSDGGAKGDHLTNDRTVTIDGNAGAGNAITLYEGTKAVGTATANSAGVFHVTSSSLSDGTHTLTAVSTDANGYKVSSDAFTVTIDGTGPATAVGKLSTSGLSGTGEAGSKLTIYDAGRAVGTTTVDGDGHWSLARSVTDTLIHSYTVSATDAAGNTTTTDAMLVKGGTGTLSGTSGDDILKLGAGQTASGGYGHDLFVFDTDSGKTTISDFARGTDDIQIDHSLASSWAEVKSHAVQKGYDVVITFDADHVLTLKSATLSTLSAGDFVFS